MRNLSQPAPAAPAGPDLVRRLVADAGVRDRVLTDGRQTVSYAGTAELLDRLDRSFADSASSGRSTTSYSRLNR